jgi:hypothetical protein
MASQPSRDLRTSSLNSCEFDLICSRLVIFTRESSLQPAGCAFASQNQPSILPKQCFAQSYTHPFRSGLNSMFSSALP